MNPLGGGAGVARGQSSCVRGARDRLAFGSMKRLSASLRTRTNGYTLTPQQYTRLAWVALGAFTLIVLTGAAVRLTGSGLGCPEWPKCYGKFYPPLATHALIEYSNRTITVPVSLVAIAAWLGAFRRRPYRRDLMWLSLLLPAGVLAQAILGGLTVEGKLAYGWVMAHFCLSMVILIGAVVLVYRARQEPAQLGRQGDALLRRVAWALAFLCGLTIFAGTAATAAGPHSGGEPGQPISRLSFDGRGTMDFVIHRHAEVAIAFGLLAVLFWWLVLRRSSDRGLLRLATALCLLIALQGAVGAIQYETHLPTELVWVHVGLATFTWLTSLWCLARTLQPPLEAARAGVAERLVSAQMRISGEAPAPSSAMPDSPVSA
jgi:cytochrome c oxidase assembly protein subunit 15